MYKSIIKIIKKNIYFSYTLLFLVAGVVIFSPLLQRHYSFVAMGDSMNQFYPALSYISDYYRHFFENLLHGKLIMFDSSIGFGDDVIGSLSYYGFGDIFTLPSFFCPQKYLSYAYTLITLSRFYLSGISFIFYAHYKKFDKKTILVCALMYSYSNYALGNGLNFFTFSSVMVLFPFFVYGMNRLTDEEMNHKAFSVLFILTIFIQTLSGFYFLYMNIVFCLAYFAMKCAEWIYCKKAFSYIFRRFANVFLHFFLGIGMGAVVLMPVLFEYLQCARKGASTFSIDKLFSLPSKNELHIALTNIITPASSGYVNGMCVPIIVIICLIFVIRHREIVSRKLAAFIIVSLFGYFFPTIGIIMNGFAYNTTRWYYMMFFVFGVMMMGVIPKLKESSKNDFIWYVIAMLCWAASYLLLEDDTSIMIIRLVCYLAFWIVTLLLIFWDAIKKVCEKKNKRIQKLFYFSIIANLIFTAFLGFASEKIGGSNSRSLFKWVNFAYSEISDTKLGKIANDSNTILAGDNDEFARYDINDTALDASLLFGINTTFNYYSLCNGKIYDVFNELRISPAINDVFTLEGLDGRQVLETLLSVKSYAKDTDNYEIEENKYYLPLGFCYDDAVNESDVSNLSQLQKMNLMMKDIIIDNNTSVTSNDSDFDEEELGYIDDVPAEITYDESIIRNGNEIVVKDGSTIHVTFDNKVIDSDNPGAELYLYLYNLTSNPSFEAYVEMAGKAVRLQDISEEWYYQGNYDYLVNVQNAVNDGSIDIVFKDSGTYTLDGIKLVINHYDSFERNYEKFKDNSMTGYSAFTNGFSGTVDNTSEKWLFVSYPYSKGWTCKIDGQETEISCANYSFMAVKVPKGKHSVEFTYITPGIIAGGIISLITILIFASICIFNKNSKHYIEE